MTIVAALKRAMTCAVFAAVAADAAAKDIPAYWRKTMTNDPKTNYYLAKVEKSFGDADADLLRTVLLSLVAVKYCRNVDVDHAAAQAFLHRGGYYELRGDRWTAAQFAAADRLRGTTYREVAHLCAGLDYLFGPQGKLAPHLLHPGAGLPKGIYDERNPYIKLPELPQPGG